MWLYVVHSTSSVHPSSVVVNSSNFRHPLWNRWTEFNESWQETGSQRPLPRLCFQTDRKKTRWPPQPLIGWCIFVFSSETVERNRTRLDRKQDLSAFYKVCVFLADRKNKMAAPASDWHFRLLLRNCWTEFNKNWQEARDLPGFVVPVDQKSNMVALVCNCLRFFRILPCNRWREFNATSLERKISTPFTKFVFFVPIGNPRWPPWSLIGWDFSTSLQPLIGNRRWLRLPLIGLDIFSPLQPLRRIWQVARTRQTIRYRATATLRTNAIKAIHYLARSQCPLPSLCFMDNLKSKMAALASETKEAPMCTTVALKTFWYKYQIKFECCNFFLKCLYKPTVLEEQDKSSDIEQ